MICRAKYHARCYRCGTAIIPGQMIDWQRSNQCARHAACQTESQRAIAPFDHERGHYGSPSGAKLPEIVREPVITRPLCGICGKRVEWYRSDGKPLCDSCQENARIENVRKSLRDSQLTDGDGPDSGGAPRGNSAARALEKPVAVGPARSESKYEEEFTRVDSQ